MSIDICRPCGRFVDTDADPDCYLVTERTADLPKAEQRHECICEICREELPEEELERRVA